MWWISGVQHDDRPSSVLHELVILLGIANQLFEHSADMTPDAQVRFQAYCPICQTALVLHAHALIDVVGCASALIGGAGHAANELVILLGIANQLLDHSADMTPDAQVRGHACCAIHCTAQCICN
jgi:hypothetical protein